MSLILFQGKGAKTKNYTLATTHFLSQLVSLEVQDALNLLKGLVVNTSGEKNRGVATDMFLEHLIGVTKESSRDGQSLESMERLTVTIDFSLHVRETVREGLGIKASSTHNKPDTREAVKKAAGNLIAWGKHYQPDPKWTNPFLVGVKAEVKLGELVDDDDVDQDASGLRPEDQERPLEVD